MIVRIPVTHFKDFLSTGRIIRKLISQLGRPNYNGLNQEHVRGQGKTVKRVVNKITGWNKISLEDFAKAYLAMKEQGIEFCSTDKIDIRIPIPNDLNISSFFDSDDESEWVKVNKKKNDRREKRENIGQEEKDRRWLIGQQQREVRTALDGKCSLHRVYGVIIERKCLDCEAIKLHKGLPNEYQELSNLRHYGNREGKRE